MPDALAAAFADRIPRAPTLDWSGTWSTAGNERDPATAAQTDSFDLVIVGGCGHVGLSLALSFAGTGCQAGIYDIDDAAVDPRARHLSATFASGQPAASWTPTRSVPEYRPRAGRYRSGTA